MSTIVTIEEAAERINIATQTLDEVTDFIEKIAYSDAHTSVPHPTDPSKYTPSVEKLIADAAHDTYSRIEVIGLVVGGACEIDFTNMNAAYTLTLAQPDTAITFQNTGGLAGRLVRTILFIEQGTGANMVSSWPSNIKWSGGVPPVLSMSAGDEDMVTLTSHDGGNNWYGN